MVYTTKNISRQPQNFYGINKSSPINIGLVNLFLPNTTFLDALNAGIPLNITGSPAANFTDHGRGFSVTSAGAYFSLNKAALSVISEFTLLVLTVPLHTSVATSSIFSMGNSVDSNPFIMLLQGSAGTTIGLRVRNNAGTDIEFQSTSSEWVDEKRAIVIARRSELQNLTKINVNGLLAVNSTASAMGATTLDRTAIGTLLRGSAALGYDGSVHLVAVWKRALSDAEVQSLSVNPWQIFQPTNKLWVMQPSAGGVTQALSGVFIPTDGTVLAGSIVPTFNILGSYSKTDGLNNQGTITRGAVNLSGQFSKTDAQFYLAILAATFPIQGQFASTDANVFAGAVTALRVLSGQYSATDAAFFLASLSAGSVNLSGGYNSTDGIVNAGSLSVGSQLLNGVFSNTDALIAAGIISLGALSLSGNNSKSDEANYLGVVAPLTFPLTGIYSKTDAVVFPGGATSIVQISGGSIKSDEALFTALFTLGAIPLGGGFSKSDEASFTGVVFLAGQVLGGTFSSSDALIRAGIITPSPAALLGAYAGTDQKENAGTLYLLAALAGGLINTDEKMNSGSTGLGSVNLSGQLLKSDENIFANSVQALFNLFGATIITDTKLFNGAVNFAGTSISGSRISPDEILNAGIFTFANTNLLGKFSKTDEALNPAFILFGALLREILRKNGHYVNTSRNSGLYLLAIRKEGKYNVG